MNPSRLMQSVILLLIFQAHTFATDLTKIDRSIGKEPAYASKPKYCLVVFGPEAKTRLWVVLDGGTVYGSGKNGELSELTLRSEIGYYLPVPGTSRVLIIQPPDKAKGVGGIRLEYQVESDAAKRQTIEGTIRLGDDPRTAPVIHFDGSYTSTLRERSVIQKGQWVRDAGDNASLHVYIGSNVLQDEGKAFVRTWWQVDVPDKIRPIADIEFPHQDPKAEPLKMRVPLVYR